MLEAFKLFVEKETGWTLMPDNHEGVHGDWALMRKSLHDPQIPINIESDRPGGVAPLRDRILAGFDAQLAIPVFRAVGWKLQLRPSANGDES